MFIQNIQRFCQTWRLVEPGETILIAVSGGQDSMALLETFYRLKIPSHAAHLNHMLRGEESDLDAEFVAQQAKRRGIPAEIGGADIAAQSRERGVSIETAARNARKAFLRETAQKVGASKIALAHHQDDLAETALMRLLRGAGAQGLAGMSPKRGRWIRPFLHTPKSGVAEFVQQNDIPYREDSSNKDPSHLRNWTRLEAMPILRRRNPNAARAVANAAQTLAAENDLLNRMTSQAQKETVQRGWIDLPKYRNLPTALQRRLMRRVLKPRMIHSRDPSFNETERARLFALADQPNTRMIARQTALVRYENALAALNAAETPSVAAAPLHPPYRAPCRSNRLDARIIKPRDLPKRKLPKHQAAFDWDKLPKPLLLRNAAPDDIIHPYGSDAPRRAFNLMAKAGMSALLRPRTKVVCAQNGDLLWIPGIAADRRPAVSNETERILFIQMEKIAE